LVYFAFFGDGFKSGVSVDLPNLSDKASQLTEIEAIANMEAETASLNGSVADQTLSSIVVAGPPDVIVVDSEDRQELESSTAMVLALSSEDEIMEVSKMESHGVSFLIRWLIYDRHSLKATHQQEYLSRYGRTEL
jgi:hypothetical protein